MAFINHVTKNLAIKIVYYGPGLSGKTTNLRYIYFKLESAYRGDLICLETDTERTFFFDLLPVKAGLIGDFKVHFQLMTVPGQVFYEASRRSVLKGADGIIFVADSQIPMLDANLESFDALRRNLQESNIDLNQLPLVFQYNKRDLDNLIPVETFNNLLNPQKLPYIEASAINGWGVFESLHEIAKLTVPYVRENIFGEKRRAADQGADEREIKRAISEKLEQRVEREEARKDEIEIVAPSQAAPIKMTKVKIRTQEDIEQEIEKLSEEFTSKTKGSSD